MNHQAKVGLSINEAAAAIGISRAAFYILLREGRGPDVRKIGARSIVLAASLQEWLRKQPEYTSRRAAA